MHQEKYKINWHTYSDHLRDMLHNMMKSDQLTDVTLVCDDKRKFKAHKIVLSACSLVFKSIIDDLPNNDSMIYLKGIHYQDMESILEFMYLGVATFYQDRMNEFLNVAKSLEIKVISGFDYERTVNSFKNIDLEENSPQNLERQETNIGNGVVAKEETNLLKGTSKQCPECEKMFASAQAMTTHYNSIHCGIKYECNQCDFQGTTKGHLTLHIRSKHEGVKYACKQCNYQAAQLQHLNSQHEGLRYNCDQCNHQSSDQSNLKRHKQAKHEATKFKCDNCDYENQYKHHLKKHIQSKHEGVI